MSARSKQRRMPKHSTNHIIKRDADKVAHISDAAALADKAARHFAKNRPTRAEVESMIDDAFANPFSAMYRGWLRRIHKYRRELEAKRAAKLAPPKLPGDPLEATVVAAQPVSSAHKLDDRVIVHDRGFGDGRQTIARHLNEDPAAERLG